MIHSQEDLPGSIRPRIIKLHGSISHSGNYIITEEDYRKYPIKYAPFVNTVQQSMLESRLCLIGFSGSDPNFLNWVGWLRDNMGENCPQIYLCGVFDCMSLAERKMFENKKISIVDISELSQEKSKNRYYTALNKFINLLYDKSKENNTSIIDNKIYTNVRYASNLSELESYYKDMVDYTDKIIKEIKGYVCLPSKKQLNISEYIQNNFMAVIYDKNENDMKLQLIGNFTYILRYVNEPLYDREANKLLEFINSYSTDECKNLDSYINIILYLLLMYRLDANSDMYEECTEKMERIEDKMDVNQTNEFYIEKTKNAISLFDYDKGLKCVEKIKDNSNYGIVIKKACLLRQLNEKDKALSLLKGCYADLAQKKYSENKKASLIGYINLCARSLLTYGDNLDAFKDDEYYTNDYNTKKIVIESRDDIVSELYNNKNKENTKEFAFNPNSYTMSHTMGNTNKEKKVDASFRYLLLQDLLCLPIYRDHKDTITTAIEIIDSTSKSPLWKWSRVVSMNDDKIINSYFTRERIYNTDKKLVEEFLDYILKLWHMVTHKRDLNTIDKLLSEGTIIDILSRLSIILDEVRVANLIHALSQLNDYIEYEEKTIFNAINRVSYSFNTKVLELCLDDIFEKMDARYSLAIYFQEVNANEVNVTNIEKYIRDILNELESDDIKIRDNALSKTYLLKRMGKLDDYYENVSDKIWAKLDDNGLPTSKLYLPVIWIKLPHPKNCSLNECYKKYLLEPNFIRRVIDQGVSIGSNPIVGIKEYLSCFRRLTCIDDSEANINLNEDDLLAILKYLYDYINNEKSLLNDRGYYIFGEADTAKECFVEIGLLVSYIYIYGKMTNKLRDEVEKELLKFTELYDSLSLGINVFERIEKIDSSRSAFREFEKLILSGDSQYISIAFLILKEIIRVFEEKNEVDIYIMNFINKIPYMEIDIAKEVLLQMPYVIKKDIFLNDDKQAEVISVFSQCYDIYDKRYENSGKVALDAIYNLSNLMKTYYEWLSSHDKTPNDEFEKLKGKFETNKLNEIRMTWKD